MTISATSIDTCLWAIEMYLMRKYGVDTARRDMEPLKWYVNTGRGSVDDIRRILSARPYVIGRLLHQGGSYDEAIARVLAYKKGARS